MTKFYEICNRCDFEVICECPYCEPLLEALKEIIEITFVGILQEDEYMTAIDNICRTAIKEANDG